MEINSIWRLVALLALSSCLPMTLTKECVEQQLTEGMAGYVLVINESFHMTELATNAMIRLNKGKTDKLGLEILSSQCSEIQVEYKLWQRKNQLCVGNNTNSMIGVIGPDNEKFRQALGDSGIPYITSLVKVELLQKAKAIAELAVSWNWDYTTILCGDDEESTNLLPLLRSQLVSNAVCYEQVNFTSRNLSQAVGDAADLGKPNGVIVLGKVSEVDASQFTSKNTWIVSSSSSQTSVAVSSLFVLSSDKISNSSIISEHLESALKNISKAYNSTTASCFELADSQQLGEFRLASFISRGGFQASTPNVPVFIRSLKNSDGKLAASYNGTWSFTNKESHHVNKSWCTEEACAQKCREQNPPKNFTFVDGDYILVVTAPIHDTFHAYPDLYSCSQFNKEAAIRTQAALHARNRLQNLTKINFGLLVLDTCFNEALAQKYMADILNGSTPYYSNGKTLDRKKIVGVIGDLVSHVAVAEQRMLIPAGLIQVSYGSSTDVLNDKQEFTNFLRVNNANNRVIENIVQVLEFLKREQDAEINTVVVIHTDTGYGMSGGRQLVKILKEHNYCTHNLAKDTPFKLSYSKKYEEVRDEYEDFWKVLHETVKTSMVFVYTGEEKAIRDLLRSLKESGFEDWWKKTGSIFIMAEIWEDRKSLLIDYRKILRGSLSFKMLPNFEVDGFKELLRGKEPNALDLDQTFNRLFEEQNSCKIRGDFQTNQTESCRGKRLKISNSNANDELTVDIYTTNLVKAMYAFGFGFKQFMTSCCREKEFECFRKENRQLRNIIEHIRIPPNDLSSTPRDTPIFDSNKDGTGGYDVFSQQYTTSENGQVIDYRKVFTFEKQAYGKQDLLRETGDKVLFYRYENNQDIVQKPLKANHCRNNCPCPASAPSTLVILLATALSLVSAILAIMVGKRVWRRFGCRIKFPFKKREGRSSDEDVQSQNEIDHFEGSACSDIELVESGTLEEKDGNDVSSVHAGSSYSISFNGESRSPSIDTGCDCSELQEENERNNITEPVKPPRLRGPTSDFVEIRAPVPLPRIHTISSSTE